jgi:hypothetical protein
MEVLRFDMLSTKLEYYGYSDIAMNLITRAVIIFAVEISVF